MPLKRFLFFTFAGSTLWMGILLALGYFIGHNQEMIKEYVIIVKLSMLAAVPIIGGFYYWRSHRNRMRDLKVVGSAEQS